MPAITLPLDLDLTITSFDGLAREDPWNLLDSAGYIDAWKAAGLRFFATADDFDAADFSVGGTDYTAKWENKLLADYAYNARQQTGQTGTQALVPMPSGLFGDLPVVDIVSPSTGDMKLEIGSTVAAGAASVMPATGAFRLDVGAYLGPENVHLVGDPGNTSNKLLVTVVGNDIRFFFASSGTGTRSVVATVPYDPRGKLMQFAFIRRADNFAVIRYRQAGDADWTEVVSGAVISNATPTPYSIGAQLAFADWTPIATYDASGQWRYIAAWWGGNPLGDDLASWEKYLTYSNGLR